jgi:hypothetical protein
MSNNTVTSLAQVKNKRASNKPPLNHSPIIFPEQISKAAAIARRRARHQFRLECFALVCLISLSWRSKRILAELERKPLIHGFNTITEGVQTVVFDKEDRRTTAYIPADYFYTKVLNAAARLQTLLEYHHSFLSEPMSIAIKEALDWHTYKCSELWTKYGSLPPLVSH